MPQGASMTDSRRRQTARPLAGVRQVVHGRRASIVAVSAGGAIGATARYAIGLAWPTAPGHFPTSTLVINVLGCALMGALMVVIAHQRPHRLVRLFAGTGILGGFTTFSTYEVQTRDLLRDGHGLLAASYLLVTLVAALVALSAATRLTRTVLDRMDGGRP